MAIINSVATTGPGYGSGFLTQRTGIAVSSGTGYSIPVTGSVSGNPIYRGKVRIKIYNGIGTSPTVTLLTSSITDGTNTVVLPAGSYGSGSTPITPTVTLSSTNWLELVFEFLVDYSTAGGGATGTLLGPGNSPAIVLTITPTLGGTSPGATMDVEIYGEP